MARANVKNTPKKTTYGGAQATPHLTKFQELERSVLSCLLWEDEFYEDGVSIAKRIQELVGECKPEEVSLLANRARHEYKLRHVPLWLLAGLYRHKLPVTADVVASTIQRPDEMGELLTMYWAGGKKPIPASLKKGLARAFTKFDAYQLAKYNRDANIKLRDILFLVHPKPTSKEQQKTWDKLASQTLESANTWETRLSAGEDKKATFSDLIATKKLGHMACLRNLRNMKEAGMSRTEVGDYLLAGAPFGKALPFRYVAAAQQVPAWEPEIDKALVASFTNQEKLTGKTIIVVDKSGSMHSRLSGRSNMTRMHAAYALAGVICGLSEEPVVFATAGSDASRIHDTVELPPRAGLSMGSAIDAASIGGGGIFLTQCMDFVYSKYTTADRVIVITDEADCDMKLTPDKAKMIGDRNYIINLASYQNGIAYDKFTHINGFSDAVVNYIQKTEEVQ